MHTTTPINAHNNGLQVPRMSRFPFTHTVISKITGWERESRLIRTHLIS